MKSDPAPLVAAPSIPAASAVNDPRTMTWWTGLRGVATINLLAWVVLAAPRFGESAVVSAHVVLSAIFTAVCAFRSFLPRIDLERFCLVDSWWSSVVIGRSAATIAEVSFAAQVALTLHGLASVAGAEWGREAAYAVVPLLTLAQVFCWYSVLTLNHVGHAIEQSLWTSTMAGVGVCLAFIVDHLPGSLHTVAILGMSVTLCFVVFMTSTDIPMYVRRWRSGRNGGARYLGLRDGALDAWRRREVTRAWSVWKPETAWLTGYFSFAVWLSIALVHLARML